MSILKHDMRGGIWPTALVFLVAIVCRTVAEASGREAHPGCPLFRPSKATGPITFSIIHI